MRDFLHPATTTTTTTTTTTHYQYHYRHCDCYGYCYCYCHHYYHYFIPIAAGRSAWRSGSGSALHPRFVSAQSTWASSATNSCKLATYSTSRESEQVYIAYTTWQLDELVHFKQLERCQANLVVGHDLRVLQVVRGTLAEWPCPHTVSENSFRQPELQSSQLFNRLRIKGVGVLDCENCNGYAVAFPGAGLMPVAESQPVLRGTTICW